MKIEYCKMNIETDWPWIVQRIDCVYVQDMEGFIALDVEDNHRLVGAFVGCFWSCTSVAGHIIMETPYLMRHGFMEKISSWVFDERGCEKIVANITSTNKKSIKLMEHIGFKHLFTYKDIPKKGQNVLIYVCERLDNIFYKKGANNKNIFVDKTVSLLPELSASNG